MSTGIKLTLSTDSKTIISTSYTEGSTECNIPNTITAIGASAFVAVKTNLTNVIIPLSVSNIGNNAFQDCSKLTNIIIPFSVTNIGNSAFLNCRNLTNISLQRYGDLGKTTLNESSFKFNSVLGIPIVFGLSNSDYSESVATLFSNGYTHNELSLAGFDVNTLNSYYLNNKTLCSDASIDIDLYNNYNITTLDTSIYVTDTTANKPVTSFITNNVTNDGTINSINYSRQFFKLYNNADNSLNTNIYTITPKKKVDIDYAMFGRCESGGTQSITKV